MTANRYTLLKSAEVPKTPDNPTGTYVGNAAQEAKHPKWRAGQPGVHPLRADEPIPSVLPATNEMLSTVKIPDSWKDKIVGVIDPKKAYRPMYYPGSKSEQELLARDGMPSLFDQHWSSVMNYRMENPLIEPLGDFIAVTKGESDNPSAYAPTIAWENADEGVAQRYHFFANEGKPILTAINSAPGFFNTGEEQFKSYTDVLNAINGYSKDYTTSPGSTISHELAHATHPLTPAGSQHIAERNATGKNFSESTYPGSGSYPDDLHTWRSTEAGESLQAIIAAIHGDIRRTSDELFARDKLDDVYGINDPRVFSVREDQKEALMQTPEYREWAKANIPAAWRDKWEYTGMDPADEFFKARKAQRNALINRIYGPRTSERLQVNLGNLLNGVHDGNLSAEEQRTKNYLRTTVQDKMAKDYQDTTNRYIDDPTWAPKDIIQMMQILNHPNIWKHNERKVTHDVIKNISDTHKDFLPGIVSNQYAPAAGMNKVAIAHEKQANFPWKGAGIGALLGGGLGGGIGYLMGGGGTPSIAASAALGSLGALVGGTTGASIQAGDEPEEKPRKHTTTPLNWNQYEGENMYKYLDDSELPDSFLLSTSSPGTKPYDINLDAMTRAKIYNLLKSNNYSVLDDDDILDEVYYKFDPDDPEDAAAILEREKYSEEGINTRVHKSVPHIGYFTGAKALDPAEKKYWKLLDSLPTPPAKDIAAEKKRLVQNLNNILNDHIRRNSNELSGDAFTQLAKEIPIDKLSPEEIIELYRNFKARSNKNMSTDERIQHDAKSKAFLRAISQAGDRVYAARLRKHKTDSDVLVPGWYDFMVKYPEYTSGKDYTSSPMHKEWEADMWTKGPGALIQKLKDAGVDISKLDELSNKELKAVKAIVENHMYPFVQGTNERISPFTGVENAEEAISDWLDAVPHRRKEGEDLEELVRYILNRKLFIGKDPVFERPDFLTKKGSLNIAKAYEKQASHSPYEHGVREIASTILRTPRRKIKPDMDLREQLSADELDMADLVEISQYLNNTAIDPHELPNLRTVQSIADRINQHKITGEPIEQPMWFSPWKGGLTGALIGGLAGAGLGATEEIPSIKPLEGGLLGAGTGALLGALGSYIVKQQQKEELYQELKNKSIETKRKWIAQLKDKGARNYLLKNFLQDNLARTI